jgi:hypothetical protein
LLGWRYLPSGFKLNFASDYFIGIMDAIRLEKLAFQKQGFEKWLQ